MHRTVLVSDDCQQTQLLRMRDTEPGIEKLISQRKDGCVSPNGERQRDDRNRCKPRAFAQNAGSILQITPQFVPPAQPE